MCRLLVIPSLLVFCWVVRAPTVSWGGRRMECRTPSPRWIQESQRCRCPLTTPLRFWTRPCLDSHHGTVALLWWQNCSESSCSTSTPSHVPNSGFVINFRVSLIDELTGCFPQVEELVGPRNPHTSNDLLLLLHRLPGSNSADGNCKYKQRVAFVLFHVRGCCGNWAALQVLCTLALLAFVGAPWVTRDHDLPTFSFFQKLQPLSDISFFLFWRIFLCVARRAWIGLQLLSGVSLCSGPLCSDQVLPGNHHHWLQRLPLLWSALVQDVELVRTLTCTFAASHLTNVSPTQLIIIICLFSLLSQTSWGLFSDPFLDCRLLSQWAAKPVNYHCWFILAVVVVTM